MASAPLTQCQICGNSTLESVLFVGYVPPVNTMPAVGSIPTESQVFPLELKRCGDCSLVQIGFEVDPHILFPPEYPYRSGTTRILRENFSQLCDESSKLVGLKKGDLVIDIGSNDGTLLTPFYEAGYTVLGVEPSRAAQDASARGIRTKMDYFSRKLAQSLRQEFGQAKLITAANVFAHIGDPNSIVEGILEVLQPQGVFVNESHSLLGLVETLQYDTIYHEHLRYYSVGSLNALLSRHGLEIFHVRKIPTHGGSIRVYSARKGAFPIQASVLQHLEEEERAGLRSGEGLRRFRDRVAQSKLQFYSLLAPLRERGARIYGVGAPSRASTLICYLGLDQSVLNCVLEVPQSPKVGKYIPGTRIPVLEESKLLSDQPEYALLLSWHIAPELMANLRRKGYRGSFIVPLPEPRILNPT